MGQQENPFLQQQARFQYPPGLHQEQEKEPEQERPRMHNGKKVSNININISMVEYSEIFLFPGPKPPDDLLECPDPAAGAEVPGCTDHLQVAIGMGPQNFPDYLFLSYSVRFKR